MTNAYLACGFEILIRGSALRKHNHHVTSAAPCNTWKMQRYPITPYPQGVKELHVPIWQHSHTV